MATENARAVAILENLLNAPSTAAQRNELLAVFGDAHGFLQYLRTNVLRAIKDSRSVTAVTTSDAGVETDFPETP